MRTNLVTLLRHPWARLSSDYYYFRSKPQRWLSIATPRVQHALWSTPFVTLIHRFSLVFPPPPHTHTQQSAHLSPEINTTHLLESTHSILEHALYPGMTPPPRITYFRITHSITTSPRMSMLPRGICSRQLHHKMYSDAVLYYPSSLHSPPQVSPIVPPKWWMAFSVVKYPPPLSTEHTSTAPSRCWWSWSFSGSQSTSSRRCVCWPGCMGAIHSPLISLSPDKVT